VLTVQPRRVAERPAATYFCGAGARGRALGTANVVAAVLAADELPAGVFGDLERLSGTSDSGR